MRKVEMLLMETMKKLNDLQNVNAEIKNTPER
jgi:hypothetical protein